MSRTPAYRRVYTQLKQNIKEGTYKPDALIPTEPELEREYGVSRTTIRKAISLLSSEGFLEVRQGHGTKVLDPSNTQRLNRITSISETLAAHGHVVSTQGMYIEKIPAPDFVAKQLHIPVNTPVYRVDRVQCADSMPIALMTNYLRANLVPNLELYLNQFTSLYAFLESRYNIILTEAEERLTAVSASFTDSQILRIPVGSALIYSKRTSFVEQGAFEYSLIKIIADKYEYCIFLKGR